MSEPTTTSLPATAVDPDLEIGQQVGEYVVEGKLGQGAFGSVFRASHPVIGKQVAIKVLARKFSVDPEMVSRFQAEAKAVNQIRHRHIIDIFSFSTLDDGRHYYVMEYLDGEPLDALLERSGRLELGEALPILRAIARALDAAHAKGIAHRDLKAENVFLATDADGADGHRYWPKLLDFGIAKLMAPEDGLKHKTRTGTPVGTPYYMSPEQCRGRDVDHRTDIYAFGVLAYLLLTGKYPHDADDYLSILMRQMTVEPELPSSLAPLPPGIDEAIAWLLAKDPAARPPNLRTAVAALEAAAEEAGIALATAAWDAQSGPVGHLESGTRPPNLAVARTGAPAKGASSPPSARPSSDRSARPWSSSTTWASAPTVHPASDAMPAVPAARARGRGRWIAILAGATLAAAVAVLVMLEPWRSEPVAAPEPPPPAPAPAPAPRPEPRPPAPEPAPPPPPPIEEQFVIVTVEGVPEGTDVMVGGMIAGAAPGPVQLPRDRNELVLTFRREGYLPVSRAVTPDRDQTIRLTLKKKPPRRRGRKSTKDDIIDVFGNKGS